MNNIIKKYISMISIKDIYDFGIKNDIVLNDNEMSTIYNVIKNDYELLLNNDDKMFKYMEDKIRAENLTKIKKLIYEYKKKYQNYL